MSAQGGTLARRGAVHLPIWPVAALLGAAVAAAIGMSILSGTQVGPVTAVTDQERFANSSAAVREQGAILPLEAPAVNPGMWTTTQAEAYLGRLAAIESSTAAVRETGAVLPVERSFVNPVNPGMWTPAQAQAYMDALESRITYARGLENPGAYAGTDAGEAVAAPGAPHAPIMVNGEPCNQCI